LFDAFPLSGVDETMIEFHVKVVYQKNRNQWSNLIDI